MAAITTTGTLTAGNSRTFALAPGSALTLTMLPNCRVTVTETPETVSASDAGGNSPRTHSHQLAGVVTYGPYAMGGSVVVDNASNSGSTVTWGRKDTAVTTSSDGTSLVSGDGTLDIPLMPVGNTVALLGDSRTQMCQYFWFGAAITSIVRSNGVATVTISGHGMPTGRLIEVQAMTPDTFNTASAAITRTGANTFTYASPGTDGSATVTLGSVIDRSWNSSRGYWWYANMLLGGRLKNVLTAGYGGETTAQRLLRLDTVIAANPWWVIDWGFYNDIGTSGFTAAVTAANLAAIYARLTSAGIRVIAVTEPPLHASGPKWSAANTEYILAVNRAIRSYATVNQNVVVADCYPLLVDATNTTNRGAILSGMDDTDNIHAVGKGQYYVAKAIYNAVNSLIPLNSPLVNCTAEALVTAQGAYNVIDNAPWTNSGGTVTSPATGTAATGITVERLSGSTGACVASVPARADGVGYDQQMIVTPAGVESWIMRSNTGSAIILGLTGGEYRRLILSLAVSGVAGSTLLACYAYFSVTVDGVSYQTTLGGSIVSPNQLTEDYSGVLVSEPTLIPVGTITNASWAVRADFSGTGSAVTIKVGRVSWVQTSDLPS